MGGSFLTAAQLEKERGRPLADVLQAVSGADIVRGRGDEEEEIFGVNSLAPTDVLGVEVYKGGATMPLEYNATRKTCRLLVIFTKVPRRVARLHAAHGTPAMNSFMWRSTKSGCVRKIRCRAP